MHYRLTHAEPVADGIRRIAAQEIDHAISHLRVDDESLRDDGIHEARKSIKKLRGLIRLLMPGLSEAGTRDNIALRNAGRALSTLRDAAALIETVEMLSERYFTDPAMEQLAVVRSVLRRRLEEMVRGEDCRTITGGAIAALKALKRRVGRWPIVSGEFATIEPGLQGTYRRGRKALTRARSDPSPENLHTLRKRVKDHWYHVRLLDGAWHTAGETRERTLRDVQEWLGDDHNLTVLRLAIESDPSAFGGKRIVPAVIGLIGRAQTELRGLALSATSNLYSVKPAVHSQNAAAAWKAWQETPVAPKTPSSTVAKRRSSVA